MDNFKLTQKGVSLIQEKNYYPFGLTHQGYHGGGNGLGNNAAKRYGFGGKELQDENISGSILDWYNISARNYDPAIGRWMNIDPLAGQMRRHSPYNYAFDNPVYFIDPDGMAPIGPWPNPFKELRGSFYAIKNKVQSNVSSSIQTVKDFGGDVMNSIKNFSASLEGSEGAMKAEGGVVGYSDKNFTQDGLATPNEAAPGADVDYLNLTGLMAASQANGSNLSSGSKIGDIAIGAAQLVESTASININSNDSSTANSSDTTFTTTKAGSIETRVVRNNQVSSIGSVYKETVTVPKSKVDSVNNVSQQSMNKQLQDMNSANKRVLDSLKN